MKQRSNFTTRTERRARLSALVFLCLTMHALFVSLTHHHQFAPLSSHAAIVAANDNDSPSSRNAGSDASCQSCSLQRNFVADTHTPTYSVEHIVAVLAREALSVAPRSQRFASSLFGRAPPLA
ncbi:MAG: hypothetical protein ACJ74J_09185 [Blastocatellia bacterium]